MSVIQKYAKLLLMMKEILTNCRMTPMVVNPTAAARPAKVPSTLTAPSVPLGTGFSVVLW